MEHTGGGTRVRRGFSEDCFFTGGVSRFSRAGSAATDALLNGYGIERTPELEWTLAFYRVVWSVMALHWEHEALGDWFAPHLNAIKADLPLVRLS